MENEWTKEIDRLKAENERLREALKSCITNSGACGYTQLKKYGRIRLDAISDIARAALAAIEEG